MYAPCKSLIYLSLKFTPKKAGTAGSRLVSTFPLRHVSAPVLPFSCSCSAPVLPDWLWPSRHLRQQAAPSLPPPVTCFDDALYSILPLLHIYFSPVSFTRRKSIHASVHCTSSPSFASHSSSIHWTDTQSPFFSCGFYSSFCIYLIPY